MDPRAHAAHALRQGFRVSDRMAGLVVALLTSVLLAVPTTVAVAAPAVALPAPAAPGSPSGPAPVGGPLLGTSGRVVFDATGGASTPPTLKVEAYVVADLDTGAVLLARNAHERLRPASTLKTLTALTLLPQLDPAWSYLGTADDANAEGSKAGIYPGGSYTIGDLWDALFLPSGNDAAHALAMAAGGVGPTVRAMNAKAAELGALDTHAVNPSGLDADGQYSSAYDLALFARAGLARDDFRTYCSRKSADFPGKDGKSYKIQNQNRLLYNYDGALGVKTGYTTLARNTFVGAAQRNGHRLVVTLMNSGYGTWKEAAQLLDWGFANYGRLAPVGELVTSAPSAPQPRGAATVHTAPVSASVGTAAGPVRPPAPVLPLTLVAVSLLLLSARLGRLTGGRRPGGSLPRR